MGSLIDVVLDLTKSSALSDLSQLVADPAVELFALHTQEVVSGLQDATFGGDGPRSVDVVARHHADGDPGTLALPDGVWYLIKKNNQRVQQTGAHNP